VLFVAKTGKLSLFIFFVQILNFVKLFIALFFDSSDSAIVLIIFILNTLFDFLAFGLIFMYFNYYHMQGVNLN